MVQCCHKRKAPEIVYKLDFAKAFDSMDWAGVRRVLELSLADFLPIITKVDKYLAGWWARLLSFAGRLVLINAVLDAMPMYAMAAMWLPLTVIAALDSLRPAFLWNAAECASGAECLVAWAQICQSKEEGSLGVHNLVQNNYLLLKM
ncbi:retrotransposon protein [Hordeum vulgare]|nr:retrotransposon protein [Hordeum vulgare]